MAHVQAGGSTATVAIQKLTPGALLRFGGESVLAGSIMVIGTKFHAGTNVGCGRDPHSVC